MRATWFGVLGALLACSGGDALEGPQYTGSGAAPGSGGSTTSASASNAIASTAATGMTSYVCDPPAEPGSIYELTAPPYYTPFDLRSICQYRGEVMLIVNTAAL